MNILDLLKQYEESNGNREKEIKELKKVIKIMRIIESKGYLVYIVGGYVRDKLLGIQSNDLDLTTNMPVEEMIKVFNELGIKTILASGDKETKVLIIMGIEVAQFRKDVYDDNNQFIEAVPGTLQEDAERRDATINALYEDIRGNVIDVVGGIEDLNNNIIRACGNPVNRMNEDKSRILRYAYLAAKLNFKLDNSILEATKTHKHWIKEIHPNLKGKIIQKAIKNNAFNPFLTKLEEMDIVFDLFPEFKNLKGLQQNEQFYTEEVDAWTHIKGVVQHAEMIRPTDDKFILAALYHDVGKSDDKFIGTIKQENFKELSQKVAKKCIIEFGFGKDFAEYVGFIALCNSQLPTTDKSSIKEWLKKLAVFTNNKQSLYILANDLLDFETCEAQTYNTIVGQEILFSIDTIRNMIQQIITSNVFYLKDLPIDGKYIMQHSQLKGKEIGYFLTMALEKEITDIDVLTKMLNEKTN